MLDSKTWQVLVIGLGTAVAPLDTAVNIAFPSITQAFGLAIGDMQWVVVCYVLTYASLMLPMGRVGDIFGHAIVFRLGLVWSIVALLLCAAAPSFTSFLIFRCLQGIGAGMILSCGAAMTTSLYSEDRRSRVLGVYAMMVAMGATMGPWIGGMLVDAFDWPAVFWFRAPIVVAALALLRSPRAHPRAVAREPFDFLGATLLAVALITMVLALNRLGNLMAAALFLISLGAIAGFVRQEARAEKPILDLTVFRAPGFAGLNIANLVTSLAAFAVWLLVPFYLVRMTNLTVAQGGAVLATGSFAATIASPVAGRLIGRVSARQLALIGAALVGFGLVMVSAWDRDTSALALITALSVQGLGLGFFQLAYTDIVTATIPRQNRGVAGSLALVTRTFGTVGAATIVMLAFQALESVNGFLSAFQRTFAVAALLPLVMTILLARPGVR